MRRRLLLSLAVLVVLVLAAGAAASLLLDPDALRPRIEAAVARATGRALTLGRLHLRLLPVPTLEAEGASLANRPGGSAPAMLTAQRAQARLRLWPLLHGRLALVLRLQAPRLLLERTPSGPNWVFAAARPPPPAASAPSAPAGAPRPPRIWLARVLATDGVLSWRYRAGGRARDTVLGVTSLSLDQDSSEAPLVASAALTHGGPFVLDATLPPLALLGRENTALPLSLRLAAGTARAEAEATFGPAAGALRLHLAVNAPALERLRPLLPHADLPALHDLRLDAALAAPPGGPAALRSLTLQLGASDLGPLLPGLRLAGAALEIPEDRPAHLSLDGALGDAALHLGGTLGPLPAALLRLPPAVGTDASAAVPAPATPAGAPALPFAALLPPTPMPLDLAGRLGGAEVSLRGAAARDGTQLDVSATVPDVSALPPPARRALPQLRDVRLRLRLERPASGALLLHDFQLETSVGDLSGEAALRPGTPPALDATLSGRALDADALLAAWRARPPPAPRPSTTASPGTTPSTPATSAPASGPEGVTGRSAAASPPSGATEPAPAHVAAPGPAPPNLPLPLPLPHRLAGDVTLSLAALRWRGEAWRDVEVHAALADGRLVLDPLAAQTPAGPARGRAELLDAPPGAALSLVAPGLELAPLLAALGRPGGAAGRLAVDAQLSGTGADTDALLATLDGHLALSLVDGSVSDRLLEALFGTALRGAGVPVLFAGGETAVRCLALRLQAARGLATLRALALDSSRLTLTGAGTLDGRDRTLDLSLHPAVRLGPEAVGAPLHVVGPWLSPRARLDTSLGSLSFGAAARVDPCPEALAAARDGASGPMPAPPAKPDRPADMLRRLLR